MRQLARWTAYFKNINENHNKVLQKKCKPLYDYSKFVAMVRENAQKGFSDSEAIEKAVDEAIKEKLLSGFFKRQKAEVIGMILEEFDEEIFKKNVREDGYLEGVTDGQRQKAFESAENLLREGDSVEKVARCIGLSLEQVREIAETISVKA